MLEEEKFQGDKYLLRRNMSILRSSTSLELNDILAYGHDYKKKGEKMKEEFWKRGDRDEYVNLLIQYKDSKKVYMENLTEEEKKVLDRLGGVGKEKFIEEYMHDKILYSGDKNKEVKKKKYRYRDWQDRKVVMEEGVTLDLSKNNIGVGWLDEISKMKLKEGVELDLHHNNIGDEGAKAISKMELKEGVELDLHHNNIGDEGAKAISKMELKEGVILNLRKNNIGDEGAKAISKMELKEGVILNLRKNNIGDEGAEAISKMELKEGVRLDLRNNNISIEMKDKLRIWEQGYKKKGINCEVIL